MNTENLPLVDPLLEFGAQDPVLDSYLLLGPAVVLVMILFGRNPLTTALVALYVLTFTAYVLYNSIRR